MLHRSYDIAISRSVGLLRARIFGLSVAPFAVVRVVLGSVLLAAAAAKWYALVVSTHPLDAGVSGPAFSLAVVTAEILLGAWMISGIRQDRVRALAVFWFSALAGVALVKLASGETTCGCLGEIEVPPLAMVAFDVGAVVLLSRSTAGIEGNLAAGAIRHNMYIGAFALILTAAPSAAYAVATRNDAAFGDATFDSEGHQRVVLAVDRWVGKRFPVLAHIDIGHDLTKGDWVVVLYRANCEKCRMALPHYAELAAAFAKASDTRRVALIELPATGSEPFGMEPGTAGCVSGRAKDAAHWVVATPAEIWLHAGMVTKIGSESAR